MSAIQPMPPLDPEQYAALRADIEAHGIRVPVVVDQHGRVLDGNNRMQIAAELGITDVPTITEIVADDDEAWSVALTLNLARRHLTQDQKRELIRAELRRRWDDSDRAVARRIGCSPTTVGTVRSEMRLEAEQRAAEARADLAATRDSIAAAAMMMHRGIDEEGPLSWQSIGDIIERSIMGQLSNLDSDPEELRTFFTTTFGGWFDSIRAWVLDCDPDCPTCTPAELEWAREHPGQVWRHGIPDGVQIGQPAPAGGAR